MIGTAPGPERVVPRPAFKSEIVIDTADDVIIDFDGLAPEFSIRRWLLAKAEESGAPVTFLMLVEDVVGDLLDVM